MGIISILATSRSGHHWVGSVIESWFTDYKVDYLTNVLPTDLKNHKVGEKKIIVIRDYPNFIASALKSYLDARGGNGDCKLSMDRKIAAYEAILDEATFPKYFNTDVVISYQMFTKSRKYREKICEILDGKYNEEEIEKVSHEGSSFDAHRYKDIVTNVHRRYIQIEDTPYKNIYHAIIKEDRSKNIMKKWRKAIEKGYEKSIYKSHS